MPWPQTQEQLELQGYRRRSGGGSSPCRGCNKDIWWWSTPKDRPMPMDEVREDGTIMGYTPHWSTCPDAPAFRAKKKTEVTS